MSRINPPSPCNHHLSLHRMSHGQPFEEATYISHPISDMARIRGAHTDPSLSREPRPRASSPQDSSQAPEALTVPSFEDGVPSNPIALIRDAKTTDFSTHWAISTSHST